PVSADDFAAPTSRGQPLSVMADWDFRQPPEDWSNILPDTFQSWGDGVNPLLTDWVSHAEVDDPAQWTWDAGDGDGQVSPTLNQPFTIKLANFLDTKSTKLVSIHITYSGGLWPGVPEVKGYDNPPGGAHLNEGAAEFLGPNYLDYSVRIVGNPAFEVIKIDVPSGICVDRIVVDTISCPEPATLSLLALGGLAVLRRRRK
ncbi:MAG: PEP-CTERM sorting domain-containing protein, partial [Planctomycetota bacterium]|nr:PEP-CTERM sorting domain-containing protein [Planctomycetota bacterium]